jgi:cation transport ATPase
MINPLIAAVLMPASSLTVLLTAWRGETFPRETVA